MLRLAEVFLDTSYAVALSAPSDAYHARAVEVATQIILDNTRVITTRAVLLEIGNSLGRQRYRATAVELLETLEQDPYCETIPMSEELYARAFQLYSTRPDKEWGLIDCVSFIVMQDRKLSVALTADEHFVQAGFSALLRE
jgi:predicted nucleic acid-binding protein